MLLPYLRALGVEAEVLAVDPRDVSGPVDAWLAARLPADVPVHRVRAWPVSGWGFGGLAQRALVPLAQAGAALLRERHFDLVVFSTTEGLVQLLGRRWKRAFGVPFCLDYQDAWVSDYYRDHPDVTPPGGRVKFAVMNWLNRIAERRVAPEAAGLLSVSAAYVEQVEQRYPAVRALPRLVRPFPAEPSEVVTASVNVAEHDPAPLAHWYYIGRAGPDMDAALRVFFGGWARAVQANAFMAKRMRLVCIGTTYADPSHPRFRATVTPLAHEAGLGDVVDEQPVRIGYSAMLAQLQAADALLLLGSDDPAYTASKLYPYLLARRPMLVVCPVGSAIADVVARVGGAECVTFDVRDPAAAMEAVQGVLARGPRLVPLDLAAFEAFTARHQASELVHWVRTQVLPQGSAA